MPVYNDGTYTYTSVEITDKNALWNAIELIASAEENVITHLLNMFCRQSSLIIGWSLSRNSADKAL